MRDSIEGAISGKMREVVPHRILRILSPKGDNRHSSIVIRQYLECYSEAIGIQSRAFILYKKFIQIVIDE